VFVSRAEALSSIFDDGDTKLVSDRIDLVKACTLPVERNRDQCLSPSCDRWLDEVGVDVECVFPYVNEYRRGPQESDHLSRGNEAERAGDHLVSWADPECHQGQQQGIRAAGARDTMLDANIGSELFFQFGDFRTENVLPSLKDRLHPAADIPFE